MAEISPVQKKRMPTALKAVLIALLVLALFAAAFIALTYVYINNNPIEYDDVSTLVSAAPMPLRERWSVRADAGEALIRIDKSDIHWVFGRESCMAPALRALSRPGCTVEGYAVDIEDGKPVISFGINYKDKLTIPFRAVYGVSFGNEYITAAVEALYLGPSVKLPVDRVCAMAGMSVDELQIKVRRDITPRLQYLKGVSMDGGALTLACSIGAELFEDALRFDAGVRMYYALLTDRDTHRVVTEQNSGGSAALAGALRKCEADPEYLAALRCEQLAFAGRTAQDTFFNYKNSPYTERFFPGVTREAVASAEAALDAAEGERISLFTSLTERLAAARNSGALTLGEQGFLYNNAPLDIPAFLGTEWEKYKAWLDPEAAFFYPGIYKRDSALIMRAAYGPPLCAYWNDKLGACLFPGVDRTDAAFSIPGEIPEYFF